MKKLKIVLIGCGNISVMHLIPITLSKYAELAAVCDIKPGIAELYAEKYGVKAYTDYRLMLKKENPDVVHICTPHYLHTEMAMFALKNGVNVLSEKPMSIMLDDARECVDFAKKAGLYYGVIFQCRYNEPSQLVKRTLESGALGKIISARSTLTWHRPDSYYSKSDWKGTWEKEGGGVMIDQAIHSVDLVNWFIGDKVKSIYASIANRGHEQISVEDSAEGLIEYENGVRYGFYAMNNYACDEPIEIRLFCEKGKAFLSYENAKITFDDGKEIAAQQACTGVDYGAVKDYWGFMHKTQIEQFYSAILSGAALDISGESAIKTQEIICGIYQSATENKKVYFD